MRYLFLLFFSASIAFLASTNVVHALVPNSCAPLGISISASNLKSEYWYKAPASENSFSITVVGVQNGKDYTLSLDRNPQWNGLTEKSTLDGVTFSIVGSTSGLGSFFSWKGENKLILEGGNLPNEGCVLASFTVKYPYCQYVKVYQVRDDDGDGDLAYCYGGPAGSCLTSTNPVHIESRIVTGATGQYDVEGYDIWHKVDNSGKDKKGQTNADGIFERDHGTFDAGSYNVEVIQEFGTDVTLCQLGFDISETCTGENSCESTEPPIFTQPGQVDPFILCDQIDDRLVGADGESLQKKCINCVGGAGTEENKEGIWTAIGCIKREPAQIARALITVGITMGGGVALLMILVAGFILTTSQGDPKRTSEGKEMLTAAITGLLFIIFSVTILQFIGYSVLQLPGFGGTI